MRVTGIIYHGCKKPVFSGHILGFVQGINNGLPYAPTFLDRETSWQAFQPQPDEQSRPYPHKGRADVAMMTRRTAAASD